MGHRRPLLPSARGRSCGGNRGRVEFHCHGRRPGPRGDHDPASGGSREPATFRGQELSVGRPGWSGGRGRVVGPDPSPSAVRGDWPMARVGHPLWVRGCSDSERGHRRRHHRCPSSCVAVVRKHGGRAAASLGHRLRFARRARTSSQLVVWRRLPVFSSVFSLSSGYWASERAVRYGSPGFKRSRPAIGSRVWHRSLTPAVTPLLVATSQGARAATWVAIPLVDGPAAHGNPGAAGPESFR